MNGKMDLPEALQMIVIHETDKSDRNFQWKGKNFCKSVHHIHTDPWFQISLISFVCFCCPGMYNALGGMGGSGQVDSAVSANANVALLSAGAISAIFIVGPIFELIGPNLSVLVGAWTYALYSGSLLNYNHHQSSSFVIASGALLGIGANLLWIPQGVIMTTYVDESQKGLAIAIFWIIFNLGGAIGSLASFGINYFSHVGTVTDSTYIAYIIIMVFGWIVGSLFLCPPKSLNENYKGERVSEIAEEYEKISIPRIKNTAEYAYSYLMDWKIISLFPMFFNANIFYSYQQNIVNGATFNIRTRALNGALYWISQILGGSIMGRLLDMQAVSRKSRAVLGWAILLIFGMIVWGGGYEFQKWSDVRLSQGRKQDIDFKERRFIGPMFLYMFYGMFDALWQSYCYWIIGTKSNSPLKNGILVGAYKTCQTTGGAMSFRLNALKISPMKQLALNWGISIGTLLCAVPAVYCVTHSNNLPNDGVHLTESNEEVHKITEYNTTQHSAF